MSTTQATTQPTTQEPSNEELSRLTVEAAKFLGRESGDSLPVSEVIAQGKANGYDEQKVWTFLEAEGLATSSEVRIPPQRNLLGELWAFEETATFREKARRDYRESDYLGVRAPSPETHTAKFSLWLSGKRRSRRRGGDDGPRQFPVEHSYSHKAEVEKYARTKDVGRHFVREYDEFTTVLITYAAPSGDPEAYYPEHITRRRRRILKRVGVWEEYASVSLLAPSKPSAPTPGTYTHAHDALWIPGHVSPDAFDSLREVDGFDVHVSVQHHYSDEVKTPTAVNRRDLDAERGATTALPHEVGANLPVLTAITALREGRAKRDTLDASDCPPYVESWCAAMGCGSDGNPTTNGIARWRPLGRFTEIADSVKDKRGYGESALGAQALTETERQFVNEYAEDVGDYSAERICRLLETNADEFDGEPSPERVVPVIRQRL